MSLKVFSKFVSTIAVHIKVFSGIFIFLKNIVDNIFIKLYNNPACQLPSVVSNLKGCQLSKPYRHTFNQLENYIKNNCTNIELFEEFYKFII